MRVHRGFHNVADSARGGVVAIGNFDGVHRGHQAVMAHAQAAAADLSTFAGALTFEPHPREVLTPDRAPARLTPLPRKLAKLRATGLDWCYILRFSTALMQMRADTFIDEVLIAGLGVRHVVVGDNFAFGHKRQGTVAFLKEAGRARGFAVSALAPIAVDGAACSSTLIRTALLDGHVEDAASLLGAAYSLTGRVVHGDGRGRQLGFATANLGHVHKRALIPAPGVYAVRAAIKGVGQRDGVANVGWRPTFDGRDQRIEVHLFDLDIDLYGKRMVVHFHARLRGEQRFDGVDALQRQIARDCQHARERLSGLEPAV